VGLEPCLGGAENPGKIDGNRAPKSLRRGPKKVTIPRSL
jgi:hypothetical protein